MKLELFSICIFSLLIFGPLNGTAADSDWKIYKLQTSDAETFKIPYRINNATLESMDLIGGSNLFIKTQNNSNGIFEISIPRNLMDSGIKEDLDFIFISNGREISPEEIMFNETSSPCFRTLSFDFPSDSIFIGGVFDHDIPIEPKKPVLPVQLFTEKTYRAGETVTIEGCTSLNIDEEFIRIDVLGSQNVVYHTLEISPKLDGTFTGSLTIPSHLPDDEYKIQSTYGNYTVPEFSMSILILISSTVLVIVLRIMPNFKFHNH